MRYPEMAGSVAVITGAASGIGAATAADFAAQGSRVALLDVNPEMLAIRMDELGSKYPDQIVTHQVDISDDRAVAATVETIVESWGRIDYLVGSAASFTAAGETATAAQWDRALAVNVRGNAMAAAACARHMPSGSAIVNISSISAHTAQPNRWTYNATKGALISLTRCQAMDLAPRGIRVNAVSPGWIWTPEVARAADGDRAKWERIWGQYHMLGRLGEAHEVARATLFLCSNDASFITGTELMVDGGYSGLSAEGMGTNARFAGSS